MKIIYLHQYFSTRSMISYAGNRSYEFARRLVAMGHEVHMVTSLMNPRPREARGWLTTVEDGICVHWLPLPISNKMSFRQRIFTFFRFALGSALKAGSLDADVILASSGPLTVAIPALYACWRNRVPLVFEVRDLWPEGAIQLGVLTNPILIFLTRWLERFVYRASRHIIALSPGMKDGVVQTGIEPEKVAMIPNASDIDLFHPGVDNREVRRELSLDGKFSLAYFGSMGLANGLDFVLDAAAEIKRRGALDVVFILQGDGMERAKLEQRVADENLDNVIFAPQCTKDKIAKVVASVDVCMTIFKNVPVLRTCSPNKLFDAFAAGKPILTNMPGWLGELAEKESTGALVQPDDPKDFAEKVLWMRDHPADLRQFGANARSLAEKRFSREVLAKQLEQVLVSAAETKGKRVGV